MTERLVSPRFPYLPLRIRVRDVVAEVEALLDTDFDGNVIVPDGFITSIEPPDAQYRARFIGGTRRLFGSYYGHVQVGELARFPVAIVMTGSDFVADRRICDRFRIILDHGQQLVIER